MFNEAKIISPNDKINNKPETGKRLSPNNLRVVDFKKSNREKLHVMYMPYGKFLEGIAKKIGCVERRGRIVDPHTGKISDGNLCEEAILGRCAIGRQEMVPVPASGLDLVIREKAKNALFKFTKNHQPKSNESEVITSIKDLVQKKIEPIARNCGQKIEQIDFYTAVGSPLDYHYGIDGWIEIETTDEHIEKITFDLKSGNSKKVEHNYQADLLLKMDDHKIKSLPKEALEQLFRFVNEVSGIYENRLK